MSRACLVFFTFVLMFSLAPMPAPAVQADTTAMVVVARGLNNPRGITVGPDGALYVAEAGSGGKGACAEGPEGLRCFGTSSSITRIDLWRGYQQRVVTGLPSLAGQDGSFATGAHDISFSGTNTGNITIGYGGDPQVRQRDFGADGNQFGRLMRGALNRGWRNLVDIGSYETLSNPAGDEIDTNPYGVLTLSGRTIVADAGGNALLQVDANGHVTALATFPNRDVLAPPFLNLPPGAMIPMDAVPTSVALGPDGHFYVGQLTGFPFPVGGANIYRVPATGGTPEVFASGFTHIIDLTFGRDGALYVLQIAKNGLLGAFQGGDWTGSLVRVAADGTRTEIASDGLTAPGGVVMAQDGALYVTNNSVWSGTGEVVRIRP